MKKYIATLILLLLCQTGYSQKYNVDKLFKEFSGSKNSEGIKLGKIFMSFAGMFTETMGVKEIEAYTFDNDTEEQKNKFNMAIKNLKDLSYETMVTRNEDGERTKILVRIEDEFIRELIIVTSGNTNALVRIKGKIRPSDFEEVAQKHGKGEF